MSDMDGFLGKVLTDANNGANRQSEFVDGLKLVGQRQINISQTEQITDQKEYISELETQIKNLRRENFNLKEKIKKSEQPKKTKFDFVDQEILDGLSINEMVGVRAATRKIQHEYESLLSQPMHIIAQQNENFKETYEEQQTLLADWMVSQKAFKELAIQFGAEKGLDPNEVIDMGLDKKIDVLEDRNDPSHNTNVGDATLIGNRKESLIEKYHKDKALRQSRKIRDESLPSNTKNKLKGNI